MELLFVTLIGVLLGFVGYAVLPGRALTGPALLPAIGGAAAAIVWVALTWARLPWNGGWIWAATLTASVLTVLGAGALIIRARRREDVALLQRLSRA